MADRVIPPEAAEEQQKILDIISRVNSLLAAGQPPDYVRPNGRPDYIQETTRGDRVRAYFWGCPNWYEGTEPCLPSYLEIDWDDLAGPQVDWETYWNNIRPNLCATREDRIERWIANQLLMNAAGYSRGMWDQIVRGQPNTAWRMYVVKRTIADFGSYWTLSMKDSIERQFEDMLRLGKSAGLRNDGFDAVPIRTYPGVPLPPRPLVVTPGR